MMPHRQLFEPLQVGRLPPGKRSVASDHAIAAQGDDERERHGAWTLRGWKRVRKCRVSRAKRQTNIKGQGINLLTSHLFLVWNLAFGTWNFSPHTATGALMC